MPKKIKSVITYGISLPVGCVCGRSRLRLFSWCGFQLSLVQDDFTALKWEGNKYIWGCDLLPENKPLFLAFGCYYPEWLQSQSLCHTLEVQRKPPVQWFHPVLSHSSKVFVSKTANSVILLLLNHSTKCQGNKTWRLIVEAFLPQNGRWTKSMFGLRVPTLL